jgi:hypothetical protein
LTGAAIWPLCVTLNAWPAIVSVADLAALVVFAVIERVTLPVPDPPPVIVSQSGAPDAVQVHPPWVVTLIFELLAEARAVSEPGAIE